MLTRSIKQEYKQLWKPVLGFFILMPLLAAASWFAKDYLTPLLELMIEWPKEMLAFCGMSSLYNGNLGLLVFYLALIFTNMFAIAICVSSADMMNADEECGVTIFYLNQPYKKTHIFLIRLAGFLISALLKWCLYIDAVAVAMILLCRQLGIAPEAELENIYDIAWKGLPILLCACGFVVVYSMLPSRNMNYRDFILILSFLGFALGNAYKITEYLAYDLRSKQENATTIAQISENLKAFRSAYPFTVMNVLNTETQPLPEQTLPVYAGIGLLCLVLGWWMYYRKRVVEE